jgi:AmmeMemoRadiSam system protein B/AmmeMemoRadiSam system protein A
MKNRLFCFLWGFLLFACSAFGQEVREAVWAGQFYDRDAGQLAARIDGFFRNVPPQPEVRGEIKALIVPHAGYVYSGQTAAYAFALVKGKPYDTVVIIGPSHRFGFKGCSIYPKGGFRTPLGTAAVDEALAAELMKRSGFTFVPEAHEEEHSVEVQVPFVQTVLPGSKIVPIVMGYPETRTVKALADALDSACAGKKVLVIASTDMSHFLTKDKANAADAKTIELIKSLKADEIEGKMEAGENILCGGSPVAAVILYAGKHGPARAEVLKYADSAEASGDVLRVVGYVSAALVAGGETVAPSFELTASEKKELLALARSAVETYVRENRVIESSATSPKFATNRGAFVTLKERGRLRGCIGYIEPVAPLNVTIIQAAIYAAVQDARFEPVSAAELNGLEYEISVLTPLEDMPDPDLVKVGKHGLVVEMNGRKGLLLPQVPVENGWDRRTFLEQTCLKAGLPPDAWKKGARLQSFEAIVF